MINQCIIPNICLEVPNIHLFGNKNRTSQYGLGFLRIRAKVSIFKLLPKLLFIGQLAISSNFPPWPGVHLNLRVLVIVSGFCRCGKCPIGPDTIPHSFIVRKVFTALGTPNQVERMKSQQNIASRQVSLTAVWLATRVNKSFPPSCPSWRESRRLWTVCPVPSPRLTISMPPFQTNFTFSGAKALCQWICPQI